MYKPPLRRAVPQKKQFADGLIYQFAVTTVTLERLVDEINAGDLIEDFVQGAVPPRARRVCALSLSRSTAAEALAPRGRTDGWPGAGMGGRFLLGSFSNCPPKRSNSQTV